MLGNVGNQIAEWFPGPQRVQPMSSPGEQTFGSQRAQVIDASSMNSANTGWHRNSPSHHGRPHNYHSSDMDSYSSLYPDGMHSVPVHTAMSNDSRVVSPHQPPFNAYSPSQPRSASFNAYSPSQTHTREHSRNAYSPSQPHTREQSRQEMRIILQYSERHDAPRIIREHGITPQMWNMVVRGEDGHVVASAIYREDLIAKIPNDPRMWPIILVFTPAEEAAAPTAPIATIGLDTNHDGKIDTIIQGVDRNHDGIPDSLQPHLRQAQAQHVVSASEVIPWNSGYDKATRLREPDPYVRHQTDWHTDSEFTTGLPHLLGKDYYGMIGESTRDPHYMHGMEHVRRLLNLMTEAFSTDPPRPVSELKKPFGLDVLNDLYHCAGFGQRSQAEVQNLTLHTEMQQLYIRKDACGKLLDEIEHRVHEIEKTIDDRKTQKQRVLASIGYTRQGFSWQGCCNSLSACNMSACSCGSLGCNMCNPCCDDFEDVAHAKGNAAGQVDTRQKLRELVEELQVELQEKEKELRLLRQEGGGGRGGHPAGSPESVSAQEVKDRLIRNAAAKFARDGKDQAKFVFGSWKVFVQTRKAQNKFQKFGARGFANTAREMMMLCFASWKTEWQGKHEKKHQRQDHMMSKYASKFFSSSNVKLWFFEWWKVTQDNQAARRLEDAQMKAYRDAEDALEARVAGVLAAHAENQRVTAKVSIIEGGGLDKKEHSLYCVCEILGKPNSKVQTETMKSYREQHGYGVRWNHAAWLAGYSATDALVFKVCIDQGSGVIGSAMHWVRSDPELGSVTLKPSQFFPNGFKEAWLSLIPPSSNKKVNAHETPITPEIKVKVEIKMEKPPPSPRHSENLQQQQWEHKKQQEELLARINALEAAHENRGCMPICRGKKPSKSPRAVDVARQ